MHGVLYCLAFAAFATFFDSKIGKFSTKGHSVHSLKLFLSEKGIYS